MPRYAPVIPIEVAYQIWVEHGSYVLGHYHLLLAHDVVKHPDRYGNIYGYMTQEHQGTIIMDNSVVELGAPVDAETMQVACDAVNANVIVLPDHLLDGPRTYESSIMALNEWDHVINSRRGRRDVMAIPQGQDLYDWIRCLEMFAANPDIDWIGIPRNFRQVLGESRAIAMEAVNVLCPYKKVHMFGTSNDLFDDIWVTKRYAHQIRGIDSATPVWQALRDGIPIFLGQADPGKRGDWWDAPFWGNGKGSLDLAVHNIQTINRWLEA